MKVKVTQLSLTLYNPMDYAVHEILQARIMEWIAISFSRGSSQPRDQTQVFYVSCAGRQVVYHQCHLGSPYIFVKPLKSLSCVRLFVTPWTVAYHAPPSMGFSRQEYWSGCHFLLQEFFPTQGWNPGLLHCRQTLYHLSYQESPL